METQITGLVEWAFGGVGVLLIGWIADTVFRQKKTPDNTRPGPLSVSQTVNVSPAIAVTASTNSRKKFSSIEDAKSHARLLFVDDDTRFKVVKILKNAGWINTEIVKDISNLDDPTLKTADVLFVDIQGVGKLLNFKDEGLGLSMAIKERYPTKYLVIYSAERAGNRFEDAIRKADDQLYKLADSYEFEKCVHNLLIEK